MTHRCRVICVPDVARRPSIQRLRTRLESQPSYARMERRECLSASGLRARPRSGVGAAKMGVGCLVMKAVHHLGATPGSALGKRARRACCEFSQHRALLLGYPMSWSPSGSLGSPGALPGWPPRPYCEMTFFVCGSIRITRWCHSSVTAIIPLGSWTAPGAVQPARGRCEQPWI